MGYWNDTSKKKNGLGLAVCYFPFPIEMVANSIQQPPQCLWNGQPTKAFYRLMYAFFRFHSQKRISTTLSLRLSIMECYRVTVHAKPLISAFTSSASNKTRKILPHPGGTFFFFKIIIKISQQKCWRRAPEGSKCFPESWGSVSTSVLLGYLLLVTYVCVVRCAWLVSCKGNLDCLLNMAKRNEVTM